MAAADVMPGEDARSNATETPRLRPLVVLFAIFLAQFAALLVWASIVRRWPTFVSERIFGFDYLDFYLGAQDWVHNVDPYARGRLFTPPSSLLVGFPLAWLSFGIARWIALAANFALVFASLKRMKRQFALDDRNFLALLGITVLFYPFYFLVQRGNLDGLMLALLVFGFASRHEIVRGVLIGASIGVKVYSGLLFLVLLARRRWKTAALGIAAFVLLQLPFWRVIPSFLQELHGRIGFITTEENVSPAGLIWTFFRGQGPWNLVFAALWGATFLLRLSRDRDEQISNAWPVYVPWMIAFPALVYPYSAILLLAPIAMIAAHCQHRSPTVAEKILLAGFALVGVQAVAWTTNLAPLTAHAHSAHLLCELGTALTLGGACALPKYSEHPIPTRKVVSDGRTRY